MLTSYKAGSQKEMVLMTPFAQTLSDADIQNLAAHYASLSCNAAPNGKAAGDAAAGKLLAKNCTTCHGETGTGSNPVWPKLAAQKPGYLVGALKAYTAGLRKEPMMVAV